MKTKTLTLVALFCATGAQFANAADGAINFAGELVNQTCTVSVGGVVSPAVATVTLPTISNSLLDAAGKTEGRTGFDVTLSGCTGTATTAAAFFNSGSTVDPATGNLNNTTGTATLVQLQLIDAVTGTAIQAGNTNQTTTTTRNTLASGGVRMDYAVQYFATGEATAGTVLSSVTYNIDYN
ncbi:MULTISPECIES: fimbrial protein [unclassified Pseudomonas]|uniref:fimbrial protein n=1 Tax=unclassified Pseudomonas TaxID=196821 RepID=UPI0015A1DA7E|nr:MULTISPECIES: fimbrial protein [unclassified Pseudomonas]NWC96543.1 type 1 fimbrial protein [Pseudomonas sp. IPO3779]NWD17302.1 type 1 fimbrial protein [Pseudomonas sp. IPO3778]